METNNKEIEIEIEIEIENCNNIDKGKIVIKKDTLNIKYGINGTGKSTIAKSLTFSSSKEKDSNGLETLKPFKYLTTQGNNPNVNISEEIEEIKIFDEKYVNEFVFKEDELLKGSFEIFICNDIYKKGIKEIENLLISIKNTFIENKEINSLIDDFENIIRYFGRQTKSGINETGILSKTFKDGNKVKNIPDNLKNYKDFIEHKTNYKWLKWQFQGKEFLEVGDKCPFCTENVKDKKDTIEDISKTYNSKSVENLNKIVEVFNNLKEYFSDSTNEKINNFITNIDGYSDEEVNYLREIQTQILNIYQKFTKLKNIGFVSLKNVDKLVEEIKSYKIDLILYSHLNSNKTEEKINLVNNSIDELIKQIGPLKGEINKQKILIENLIREHKTEINIFLKNAGYKYEVDLIENDEEDYKLKLKHIGFIEEITDVREHLSYGEKNAFALILFMYDVIKNNPNLIILDDPISSFDKNKKYAIIDALFKKEKCFKGRTVLLLTHDFEPIIDIKHTHKNIFGQSYVSFLENVNGTLSEKEINLENILSFSEICELNVKNENINVINRLVYLRRLFEIKNNKKNSYQLISNLLHKRKTPLFKSNKEDREMTEVEIEEGEKEIIENYMDNFNYDSILNILKDDEVMKKIYFETLNNYERLHIYRIIFCDKLDTIKDLPIMKFINEAFHIENDYIFQLNPNEYQIIPQFVVDECDLIIQELETEKVRDDYIEKLLNDEDYNTSLSEEETKKEFEKLKKRAEMN